MFYWQQTQQEEQSGNSKEEEYQEKGPEENRVFPVNVFVILKNLAHFQPGFTRL
jgi:hypothetical protein